jgi:hypothetical protein
MGLAGRPKLKIDPAEVRKHAKGGSSNVEISHFLGCDEAVIRRRFAKELKQGRAERKMIIRQAQNKLAMEGNATMLIWLGKNELDQRDAPLKLEHTGADGGAIKTETEHRHTIDYDQLERDLDRFAAERADSATDERISADGGGQSMDSHFANTAAKPVSFPRRDA